MDWICINQNPEPEICFAKGKIKSEMLINVKL